METIIAIIQKILELLGIGSGAGAVNTTGGVINHTLLLAGAGWAWAHWEEPVTFTASVGSCALIAGVIYVAIEAMRRSRPPG